MRARHRSLVILAVTVAAATVSGPFVAAADAAPSPTGISHRNTRVCSDPIPGDAGCLAIRHDAVDSHGHATPNLTRDGFGPGDIRSAYNLVGTSSAGRTVAIIDAYDDRSAEADLGVYRAQYGLAACTTSNGCFKKVSQKGTTSYPKANGGWAQEISLDLDMVSAACPDCHILLVEATNASFSNLGIAVNYAARVPGVVAISNSYGGSDMAGTSAYNHPGIAITASTGDGGYGVEAPASFDSVVAVGGTSLSRDTSARGWTESAWSGAGSGCSTKNAKPAWQLAATKCTGKASADVSAVADPNTGVAVYDSYSYQGYQGWLVFGGTSASAPIVASVYALAGNVSGYPAANTWLAASALNDVTTGSNGTCSKSVWCNAATGWDGPTGLGTPNGTAAF